MIDRRALRLVVAGVWLHQGAWTKVVRRDPRHRQIVGAVPGLSPAAAGPAMAALGLGETALAVWVLSGRRPRLAAAVQTALVTGMNAGGLAFAPGRIQHPGRLVLRNAAFLACAWSAG